MIKELPNKYLFLLTPGRSGSTYLAMQISRGSNIVFLHPEGQHVAQRNNCIVHTDHYSHNIWLQIEYDKHIFKWDRLKQIYNDMFTRTKLYGEIVEGEYTKNAVLFQRNPYCIICVEDLLINFPNSYYIFTVRNPYAVAASIYMLTKYEKSRSHGTKQDENLEEQEWSEKFARHSIKALAIQKNNIEKSYIKNKIWFTYEEYCHSPQNIANKILNMLPELSPLTMNRKVGGSQSTALSRVYENDKIIKIRFPPVHSTPRNLNSKTVDILNKQQIKYFTDVFKQYDEEMKFFNYEYMS